MSDIAIRVENLSKLYRIGRKEEMHDTMVGAVTGFVRRPIHNLRRLRRLTRFGSDGDDAEDIIWALKDVSFEVKQGEVLGTLAPRCGRSAGVIGRNGAGTFAPAPSAGESTVLKILSRITKPTEGRAVIYGRVASLLEMDTGFHPELTGRENVYLNGTILGMRKVECEESNPIYCLLMVFTSLDGWARQRITIRSW